jgi:hypothetical protein
MSASDDDRYAALESAVGRWNEHVARIYPDLAAEIVAVGDVLLAVRKTLAARRTLSSALLAARARLDELDRGQEERADEVQALIERVDDVERTLDGFADKVRRVHGAGRFLLEQLAQLYPEQDLSAGMDEPVEIPDMFDSISSGPPPEMGARTEAPSEVPSSAPGGDAAPLPVGAKRPMGAILLEAGIISEQQLDRALREQRSSWNRHLGAVLVELGFAKEETIARALAVQSRFPFVELTKEKITRQAVRLIPERLAQLHTCMPLYVYGNALRVAVANPYDLIALEDLRLAASRRIDPVVATARDIREAIQLWYAKRF